MIILSFLFNPNLYGQCQDFAHYSLHFVVYANFTCIKNCPSMIQQTYPLFWIILRASTFPFWAATRPGVHPSPSSTFNCCLVASFNRCNPLNAAAPCISAAFLFFENFHGILEICIWLQRKQKMFRLAMNSSKCNQLLRTPVFWFQL